MPFEIGDMVVPVQKVVRRRRGVPPRIGVIVDIHHHPIYGPSYTVHFLYADYASVGWEQHTLQHYVEGVQSAA
jgi:hypothetical protein